MLVKEIFDDSIVEVQKKLDEGLFSSVELVGGVFDWIDKLEPDLNALISTDRKGAIQQAKESDKQIKEGVRKDLLGIPVIVKDNIVTRKMDTTAGSRMLEGYRSVYDATVIERLKSAGAIIIAKSNMDEFAMGASSETSCFGPVKNPWDISRVPGGSSSGSAVAVAAGYTWAALGSDTGGSIRQPASMCGVVGLKPTYGRVSRYGLIALGSSLDQIGPFGRRVEDVALTLKIIAGMDKRDSTSSEEKVGEYERDMRDNIKSLKVAMVKELYEGVEGKILDLLNKSIKLLEDAGVVVEQVSIPMLKYSLPVYYIIQPSECSTNLARFDGIRYGYMAESDIDDEEIRGDIYELTRKEGFGDEVKRRIMLGTFALSAGYYDDYFDKAARVRRVLIDEFKNIFDKYDALIGLTSPFSAFKIGEKTNDPLSMYLADVMTCGVNIVGLPAISLPMGLIDGLPHGIQMIGKWFGEKEIIKLAYNYQNLNDWKNIKPNIVKDLLEEQNGKSTKTQKSKKRGKRKKAKTS
ncbi:Asp-tRNA(Asn)/Glu-tRNA(Gln) amidotransferase subunit GatA [Patescibacteria group bacterium]|nr:Asp-tRNA(Asn)/Glu-tRNA(Gln) amidotransferase subunit GatA [Patescibacteria group bacterium]